MSYPYLSAVVSSHDEKWGMRRALTMALMAASRHDHLDDHPLCVYKRERERERERERKRERIR